MFRINKNCDNSNPLNIFGKQMSKRDEIDILRIFRKKQKHEQLAISLFVAWRYIQKPLR